MRRHGKIARKRTQPSAMVTLKQRPRLPRAGGVEGGERARGGTTSTHTHLSLHAGRSLLNRVSILPKRNRYPIWTVCHGGSVMARLYLTSPINHSHEHVHAPAKDWSYWCFNFFEPFVRRWCLCECQPVGR